MKVNFDHVTHETTVRLTRAEALRLVAVIHHFTETVPDPDADEPAQVENALMEILT